MCGGGGGGGGGGEALLYRSRAGLFYGLAAVWQCGSMAGPLYGSMAGPLYGSMAGPLYGSMAGPLYGSMAGHCVRATLRQSYCTAWLQHGDWSSVQYTLCT